MRKANYYLIASLYTSLSLREKVLEILDNIENIKTIQDTSDNCLELLTKHCSQAKIMHRKKFIVPFFILLAFVASAVSFSENFMPFLLFALLLTYVVIIIQDISSKLFIANKIKDKEVGDIPLVKYDKALLEAVLKNRASSIYYFKDYFPYNNHGYEIGGWSFSIDITKPSTRSNPKEIISFKEIEFYNAIVEQIKKLNLQNLSAEDWLLVNATDIVKEKLFFYNRKLMNSPDEDFIRKFINSKSNRTRFYKAIKIRNSENELVFTTLFRIYKTKESVFFETKFFILPSFRKEVKKIDKFNKTIRFGESLSILLQNIIYAPIFLVCSPFVIIESFFKSTGILKKFQKLFSDRESIGATQNIELIFRSDRDEEYFHIIDRDYYLKTIEKRILNSIIDFLEERHIDVSDFKENRIHILNKGIIMSGGEMKAGNISVGKRNKINVTPNNNRDEQKQN